MLTKAMGALREKEIRKIGIHVSIAGKIEQSVERALELGCAGTFQIFTCSPRRWDAPKLNPSDIERFRLRVANSGFEVFAHMPYLPNLCSPDPQIYERSKSVLLREVSRCEELGVSSLVLHFGSHMNTSTDEGRERMVEAIDSSLKESSGSRVRLLLENSADVKSVGSRFSEIRRVIDEVKYASGRIGVCLDICHAFAAGYDLRDGRKVAKTLEDFDSSVGLENLFLIHLNDSAFDLGSGRDRHADIGRGKIGNSALSAILRSDRLANVPAILETPVKADGDDKRNLEAAKRLASAA